MREIKIMYEAPLDPKLDDIIIETFKKVGFALVGMGTNFHTNVRDIQLKAEDSHETEGGV